MNARWKKSFSASPETLRQIKTATDKHLRRVVQINLLIQCFTNSSAACDSSSYRVTGKVQGQRNTQMLQKTTRLKQKSKKKTKCFTSLVSLRLQS